MSRTQRKGVNSTPQPQKGEKIGAPLPGVLFLLLQKLSYIPRLSAYFTYLGKVSSLGWLQSISDNHVADMFHEKPALCLLVFFPLSVGGSKRKKK